MINLNDFTREDTTPHNPNLSKKRYNPFRILTLIKLYSCLSN